MLQPAFSSVPAARIQQAGSQNVVTRRNQAIAQAAGLRPGGLTSASPRASSFSWAPVTGATLSALAVLLKRSQGGVRLRALVARRAKAKTKTQKKKPAQSAVEKALAAMAAIEATKNQNGAQPGAAPAEVKEKKKKKGKAGGAAPADDPLLPVAEGATPEVPVVNGHGHENGQQANGKVNGKVNGTSPATSPAHATVEEEPPSVPEVAPAPAAQASPAAPTADDPSVATPKKHEDEPVAQAPLKSEAPAQEPPTKDPTPSVPAAAADEADEVAKAPVKAEASPLVDLTPSSAPAAAPADVAPAPQVCQAEGCGAPLSPNAKFCGECGTKVVKAEASAPAAPAAPAEPAYQAPPVPKVQAAPDVETPVRANAAAKSRVQASFAALGAVSEETRPTWERSKTKTRTLETAVDRMDKMLNARPGSRSSSPEPARQRKGEAGAAPAVSSPREAEGTAGEAAEDAAEGEAEEELEFDESELGLMDDSDSDDEETLTPKRRGETEAKVFKMDTTGDTEATVGIKGIAVQFGKKEVLTDASWTVKAGERVALIGPNGCGKTTQLRVLTGEIIPEDGTVLKSKENLKMAVLNQSFVEELDPERTLHDELFSAVEKENEVKKELDGLQAQIDALDGKDPPEDVLNRFIDLQTLADEMKIYEIPDRIKWIMDKVGFLPEDMEQKVGLFSGGWKVRIGLSKIFMTAPDVLLLDEPTNHLDMESINWLENFLKQQQLPQVLVTHDREFMDQVASRVVDTLAGKTYTYDGTYSDFVTSREDKLESWAKRFDKQTKTVKVMLKFIKDNKGKQALSGARNRKIRELQAMRESPEWLEKPPKLVRKFKFLFRPPTTRGRIKSSVAATMSHVSHGYGEGTDKDLLQDAGLRIDRGSKVGIVGRNGSGKSTLLRLLLGEEKPSGGGDIRPFAEQSTAFFSQHQADMLPSNVTALECALQANERQLEVSEVKSIMEKFRFKSWRMDMPVGKMSGGEKARLALVRILLKEVENLVFDEPTNHLDIPMKETLEYAIREFTGTVVVVSHDRWFLSQTCSKMVAIENGEVKSFEGDYRYYMLHSVDLQRRIEARYTKDSAGIKNVPLGGDERRAEERVGLKSSRYIEFQKTVQKNKKEEEKTTLQQLGMMRSRAARHFR